MTWQRAALFAAIYGLTLVASLAVAAAVLIRLRSDYFSSRRRPHFEGANFVLRVVLIALKNLLGLAIAAAGVVMSIPGVPGQGLLTILLGLMLVDFPGKYRVERAIIGRPKVLGAINRLRARYRRPPLEPPTL